MLDLNNPRTQIIFEASAYSGKLKDLCRVYILQEFQERQTTFEQMKVVCNDLLEFSSNEFQRALEEIKYLVNQIILEINSLSQRDVHSEVGNCKVCNKELQSFKVYVTSGPIITICNECPSKLINIICQLDQITGVSWI
jgi:hypothetical protein